MISQWLCLAERSMGQHIGKRPRPVGNDRIHRIILPGYCILGMFHVVSCSLLRLQVGCKVLARGAFALVGNVLRYSGGDNATTIGSTTGPHRDNVWSSFSILAMVCSITSTVAPWSSSCENTSLSTRTS